MKVYLSKVSCHLAPVLISLLIPSHLPTLNRSITRGHLLGVRFWGNDRKTSSAKVMSPFRDNLHPVTHQPGAAQSWPCPTLGQFWKTIPAPQYSLSLAENCWYCVSAQFSPFSVPFPSPSPGVGSKSASLYAHLKVYFMENLVCNSLMRIYKVISPTRERLFLYLKQWNTFKYYIFKFSLGGWVGCCYEEKEESGEEVPSMRSSKSEGSGTWESMGCLNYGDHYSITSDRVLKILWRDLKKKKFLTMTLRFLTSNWIDGGAIHWNGEYWERAKFGNSRLVALFYTHWFWEYKLSRKVIK